MSNRQQGIHGVGRFTGFGSDRIAMPTASGDVLAGDRIRRVASSPTTSASSERRVRPPTHRSARPAPPVARSDATGGSFSDGAPRSAVKNDDSSTTGRRTGAPIPGHRAMSRLPRTSASTCGCACRRRARTRHPRDTATDGALIGAAYWSRPGPRCWRPVSESPRSSKIRQN